MINEFSASVNSNSLRLLVSEKNLRLLIEPLEALVGLQGVIGIQDISGQTFYGADPGTQPLFTAPIMVDGETIGMTVAFAHEEDSDQAQATVDYLANAIALTATETARRRQIADEVLERYDELNLIYDLVGVIASQELSVDEIMRSVLEETNRILQAEAGVIYLYDEDQSTLRPVSHFGRQHDEQFWQGRARELALSTLYAYDSTQLFENGRVICAPLRSNDERLGALMLMHEGQLARLFSANDVQLLTTLSHNIAMFVQAARLWDSLAWRNQELEDALAELQSTRDDLSKAERLSLIGQIIGGLVHDMRNPLGIVMGYAGILQEGGLSEAEIQEYATQIINYVTTFSAMAQEILDYARDDEKVNRSAIEVGAYMEEIERLLNPPGLKRRAKIVVDCAAAQNYFVYLDQQRFSRVFQNLVNNSVDAIEDHGGSQVIVRAEPTANKRIQFTISDDGPGVPEEVQDSLFEPLITTKSHGTGLGLAIVNRMVSIHDGEIVYQPSPEGGAAFVITVPQA